MVDELARPLKEKLLYPFATLIGKKVHPNVLTILAFILGGISCAFILRGDFYLALMFWGLNRIIDGLDGTLARATKQQSDFGGYLDLILDFLIYAAIPICLYLHFWQAGYKQIGLLGLTMGLMLAAFYVNVASWMLISIILEKQHLQKERMTTANMPTGIVEGMETIIFYSLFMVFPEYLIKLFSILAILTMITVVQRFVWAYKKF